MAASRAGETDVLSTKCLYSVRRARPGGEAPRIRRGSPRSRYSSTLYRVLQWQLKQSDLILVPPRDRVAAPAACLVALVTADHDRRGVVAGGPPTDQALVSAGWVAADDADRVQLVDHFCDGEQLRHRAERLAAEIGVRAGENHATAARCERGHEVDHGGREKLCFVDRDHLRVVAHRACDLLRRVDRHRLHAPPIMARHVVDASVALVEMRLEHLHALLGDERATNATDQLLALPAEHHATDHLDPAASAAGIEVPDHASSRRGRGGAAERGGRRSAPPRSYGFFAPPRSNERAGRSGRSPRGAPREGPRAGRSPRSPRSPRAGAPCERASRG